MRGEKRFTIIWLASFIVFSYTILGQIIINEIMYDYPGSDSKHEWIEIVNNNSKQINSSGWTLREGGTDHKLSLKNGNFMLLPNNYAVIADNAETFLTDYPLFNATLFDSAFSLSNSGETLILKDNQGNFISRITYNTSLGANGNGNTFCLFNSTWQECLATPGQQNRPAPKISPQPTNDRSLSAYLANTIYTNRKYTSLFKITIKNKNCSIKENISASYNISKDATLIKASQFNREIGCSGTASTGEFTPTTAGNHTLCGQLTNSTKTACKNFTVIDTSTIPCNLTINITTPHQNQIYLKGQSIKYKINLNNNAYPFTIDYWIEDLFNKIIKTKVTTTNTNQKSWKTKIKDDDKVLLIKAKVHPSCNDTNTTDNLAEKMFIVADYNWQISSTGTSTTDTSIGITRVTPTTPTFGDIVKIEAEIHKGNTAKYSVSAWAEKGGKRIGEKTKINLRNKNTRYELTLPIQIIPNCNLKIAEGTAFVVIEGLGIKREKKFTIQGIDKRLCQGDKNTLKVTKKTSAKKPKKKRSSKRTSLKALSNKKEQNFKLNNKKQSIINDIAGIVVFESSSEKAKNLIPFLLVAVFALLSIILMFKKM